MSALPKITVVTPNYNQAPFLEQTLDSVLSQGYPSLEYIVVDGNSTDGSMDIIRKYKRYLAHIIHEPDTGHANALNKGFRRSTGEVMCWINSDDILLPGALKRVGEVFRQLPNVVWLTGQRNTINESGDYLPPHPFKRWSWVRFLCGDYRHIQQESTFWRRSLWLQAGGYLDERLKLANDFELWIRFFRFALLHSVDVPLGAFRVRSGQRSVAHYAEYEKECESVMREFVRDLPAVLLAKFAHLIPEGQLVSRSSPPTNLPEQALTLLDPPLVHIEPSTWKVRLDDGRTPEPPEGFAPDIEQFEDLKFDGSSCLGWCGGPDFNSEDLIAISLDISLPVGKSPSKNTAPALIGPFVLTDQGNGRFKVLVPGIEESISLNVANQAFRLVWLRTENNRQVLLLDGVVIREVELSTEMLPLHNHVVLGAGIEGKFWEGTFDVVSITTKSRSSGKLITRMLRHSKGVLSLPRYAAHDCPLTGLRRIFDRSTDASQIEKLEFWSGNGGNRPVEPTSFSEANRLLRANESSKAMIIYLRLYEERPLKIYADNALLAARRLGMRHIKSIDQLRKAVLMGQKLLAEVTESRW